MVSISRAAQLAEKHAPQAKTKKDHEEVSKLFAEAADEMHRRSTNRDDAKTKEYRAKAAHHREKAAQAPTQKSEPRLAVLLRGLAAVVELRKAAQQESFFYAPKANPDNSVDTVLRQEKAGPWTVQMVQRKPYSGPAKYHVRARHQGGGELYPGWEMAGHTYPQRAHEAFDQALRAIDWEDPGKPGVNVGHLPPTERMR